MNRTLIVLLLVGLISIVSLVGLSQTSSDSAADRAKVTFSISQSRSHLGEGAGISPKGKELVYVGEDNALHVVEIGTQHDRILLKEAAPGIDVFSHPSFSPNGTRIVFSASGGTRYYPSDIYSMAVDGSDLRKLTRSLPRGDGFAEYFYTPMYSPDGSRIIFRQYGNAAQSDSVEIMSSDGSSPRKVTSGRPLFWSTDGAAAFVSTRNGVYKFEIGTAVLTPVTNLEEPVLGPLPGQDTFAVAHASGVLRVKIQDSSAQAVGALSLPRGVGSTQQNQTNIALSEVSVDPSGSYMLLRYESATSDLLEVVQAGDSGLNP